jgi:putative DNA methylase
MTYHKKLIEVALPLEAINKVSAREKSIRYGTQTRSGAS